MTKLSANFSLWELTRSSTAARLGLQNEPGDEELYNLGWVAVYLLEPVRRILGPLRVTSGYRCPELNAAVPGSSRTSAHVRGLAADFMPYRVLEGGMTLHAAMNKVMEAPTGIPYDQLIFEYGRWLHIGAADPPGQANPRRQALMKLEGTRYLRWDPTDERTLR